MSSRVLFIGLDGATFDILDPLMERGLMPRLRQFIASGVRGRLETTMPPITPTAWASWMTGKNPGKHGVFEFLVRRKGAMSLPDVPVTAAARHGVPFWDTLGHQGRRSIITNIPCTYPPSMVNGLMVADFLTPRGRRDFTHPRSLLEELESRFGPYRLYLTEVYAPGRVDRILDQLFDELEYKTEVNRYLATTYDWDLFATHLWGPDRLQHELWHLLDPSHPRFSAREHRAHGARVDAYWRALDATLGGLFDVAGQDTTVYLASDHGFGPIHRFLCFNVWLHDQGFLVLKRTVATHLKRGLFWAGLTPDLAYRLAMSLGLARVRLSRGVSDRVKLVRFASRVMLSLADADWSRTTAFSKGNYGQIYVNLRGREVHGIVAPGAEYERVVRGLIEQLRAARDPVTGRPLIGPIWRREDLYTGPHAQESPDIQFLPRNMTDKALGTLDFTSNRFLVSAYGNSGDHRMDGLLVARGADVRPGMHIDGARLIDCAPTILYTLGADVPADMDGRVRVEIFSDGRLARQPVSLRAPSPAGAPASRLSAQEDEELRERLRSLGYLG